MKVSVSLDGADVLQQRLARLPEHVEQRVVLQALRAGGGVLRTAIAEAIPRAERPHAFRPFKSGRGKAPGRHGQMGASHAADHVVVGSVGASKRSLAVGPATDWWYTRFMELGTVRQPPQGRVRQAFDRAGRQALTVISDRLWRGIETAERPR